MAKTKKALPKLTVPRCIQIEHDLKECAHSKAMWGDRVSRKITYTESTPCSVFNREILTCDELSQLLQLAISALHQPATT